MTIGERLEEARKRKGISIREAADATKIRSDYLLAMESNAVEKINLPEIYRRGFLRNYAKYLKVDSDKVMTDYNAIKLGGKRKERLISKPVAKQESQESNEPSLGRIEFSGEDRFDDEDNYADSDDSSAGVGIPLNPKYLRLALAGGGALLLMGLIFLLVHLFSSSDPEINPELQDSSATIQVLPVDNASAEQVVEELVTLIAKEDLTVVVQQSLDKKVLFRGTLLKDERRDLMKKGPLLIKYSNGSALLVEKDGTRFKVGKEGIGAARVP